MNVLIVDDHPVVRKGLRWLLEEEYGAPKLEEAENAAQALALARTCAWDIVILDISLPSRNGLDILKELRAEFPNLPVLVLSLHPEDQYAVRALRAGAAGYMTKESASKDLIGAVKAILKGGKYVSASVAQLLAGRLGPGAELPPHEKLSDREFQVLCRIAAGRSITEIASELSLSAKTIATFRARILEKMGMKNNAELIRYALQNKLVD